MTDVLATLRRNAPEITARQFLAAQAGCWIQYYDDTPAKNPLKALSARSFDPETVRRKQAEQCAVAYSLQAFGDSRTRPDLLCVHNFGVDVDLVPAAVRSSIRTEEIDRRKEEYLRRWLAPFPLRVQWMTETRHGFHLVLRVQPVREPKSIDEAMTLNRRLVAALRGDPNAVLITQLLRVPGTLQFKVPHEPFLCRLLLNNASLIPPYPLATIRTALGAWETAHPPVGTSSAARPCRWQSAVSGVAEGGRNVTAASLAGKLLSRLPESLWEIAWGGLLAWNRGNRPPLPDRELRSVFERIARREARRRDRTSDPSSSPSAPC